MEQNWNKKEIYRLMTADPQAVEAFLSRFASVIYTWQFYQVAADAPLAAELTEQTFIRVFEQFPRFQPRKQTLFQWLKEQARQVRDEGLLQRQMKPQRPWAWSQLPESLLAALARLRQETLPDAAPNNAFVQELVQAALAEMELPDRELMMHRYSHLDSPEHIAEEMDISIEDIESRLYRCRHSFKRYLIQIVANSNNGFAESNAAADSDILDMNLEKLLSATAMDQPIPPARFEQLRANVLEAAQKNAAAAKTASAIPYKAAIAALAAGAVLIVILLAVILFIQLRNKPDVSTVPPLPPQKAPVAEKTPPQTDKEIKPGQALDNEDVKRVFELGASGKLDALLEVLKSGQLPSQIVAAHFIGQLADSSAIEPLKEAERLWYPDGPADNPFAAAIDAIAARYPDQVTIIEETPAEVPPVAELPAKEPNSAPSAPVQAETPTALPMITGFVHGANNQPLFGLTLQLLIPPADETLKEGKIIANARTDETGQFQIPPVYEGLAQLKVTLKESNIITQTVWCEKDKVCLVSFGPNPILLGTARIDGTPLAKRTLLLCDGADPARAAYLQQIQTDNEGNFEFHSVPSGLFFIFDTGSDNRLRRLGQVQMPAQDTHSINLSTQSVQVTVLVKSEAEIETDIIASELAYGPAASEQLIRYSGSLAEDGSILFEHVLPDSYLLRILSGDGTWLQQDVQIAAADGFQQIEAAPLPVPEVIVSGRMPASPPFDLFLTTPDLSLRADLKPQPDGSFGLLLPQDAYQVAAILHGELVTFDQVDLQDQTEYTLAIDPDAYISPLSPLFTVVADETGRVLSGAQVWLTAQQDVLTAVSGRTAFFALRPDQYRLTAALPGSESVEKTIEVRPSALSAAPNRENTAAIRIEQAK